MNERHAESADPGTRALMQDRLRHAEWAQRLDHDLRTPLGTVAAAMELLRADPQSAAEAMAVIDRQLARMLLLTEELRALSRELSLGPLPASAA